MKRISDEELEKAKSDYLNEDFAVRYIRDLRGHSEDTMAVAADAQLAADKAEVLKEKREMIEEIEKGSSRMNTNMYGISLSKDWWQALKKKWLGEET